MTDSRDSDPHAGHRPADPTAGLIIIGDEILSGRTHDANLPYLAEWLGARGVPLVEVRVVRDDEAAIVEAVNALSARCAYVFTTGGIGPTHDDITSASVAKAFGVPLVRDPEAVRRMEAYYADPSMLNEARLKMCDVPEGACLIENPVSAAPGFCIGNVYVMAGIPRIMQAMLESVAPAITGGPPLLSRTRRVPLPEGTIARALSTLVAEFPEVSIGSYPAFLHGKPSVAVVLRGTDAARLDAAAARFEAQARELGAEAVAE
ncbi:MAG: competence/damage-inducible protein A [Azospirillaceae bacterium]